MKSVAILVVINFIIVAENRPLNIAQVRSLRMPSTQKQNSPIKMSSYYGKNVLPHHDSTHKQPLSNNNHYITEPEEKCAILLMSNHGQSSQQSLLRKYRYDKNGTLIPSSVQYYIKRDDGESHTLVPLVYKHVSPAGGFLRYYYKEVPPIMPYNYLT